MRKGRTVNTWRYSHFALAVSSVLFIFLAVVTGLILAFEPICNSVQPFKITGSEDVNLAHVIGELKDKYDEVLDLKVDANGFVSASVISMEEELDGEFYINPNTGEKIADIPERKPFFEFVTNLHRSLFLKTVGRVFVGITSFLLFLIAVTGLILFVKRQGSFKNVFKKVVKEKREQYYHVITGRLMLVPVVIIALSGVYLSLLRFSFIPGETEKVVYEISVAENVEIPFNEFEIFQEIKLSEVRKLEFPFTDDEDEYFILELESKILSIHQKSGLIIEAEVFPFSALITKLSFNLHTGSGSVVWSIVLAIASLNILYFIYSGTLISFQRIASRIKNIIPPEMAEYVILVGSENGSTKQFAKLLQNELKKLKQKVFVDDLNNYQEYNRMKNLVVLTSTYGEGEPPSNANHFLELFKRVPLANPVHFAVVGFGSRAYPQFCQFAVDVNEAISKTENCTLVVELELIHNKSYSAFKNWSERWANEVGIDLKLPTEISRKEKPQNKFKVVSKKNIDNGYDETFVLKIKPQTKMEYKSGDLLSVLPESEKVERLYSIGKSMDGHILLSIKIHPNGICSNYLNTLESGSIFEAAITNNADFHFPKFAKSVIMVSNGTGIAPFLGMLREAGERQQIRLYWGGRTLGSLELYNDVLEAAKANGHCQYEFAFSKEGERQYVQDLLSKDGSEVARELEAGALVMICGSVQMQKGVLKVLNEITGKYMDRPLFYYEEKGQIKMDCY